MNKKEIIEEMIKIVESEPLGYKTEEEHEKLEDFANRCIAKMRLEQNKEMTIEEMKEAFINCGITQEDIDENMKRLYPPVAPEGKVGEITTEKVAESAREVTKAFR